MLKLGGNMISNELLYKIEELLDRNNKKSFASPKKAPTKPLRAQNAKPKSVVLPERQLPKKIDPLVNPHRSANKNDAEN